MECEICYEPYDKEDRKPLTLACKCRKILCESCVTKRLNSTARCPYCGIRWSVRNYLSQCKDLTPQDVLQTLQQEQQSKDNEISQPQQYYALGSGELRAYYESSVIELMRKVEEKSAEQIEEDKNVAERLYESLKEEAQQAIIFAQEMEERDAALATRLAKEILFSKDVFPHQKDRHRKDYKNGIDKYVQALSGGPQSSSTNTLIRVPRLSSQSLSHSHWSVTSKNKSNTGSIRSSSSSLNLSKKSMLTFLVRKEAPHPTINANLSATGDNYHRVDKVSDINYLDNDFDCDDEFDPSVFNMQSRNSHNINANVLASSSSGSGVIINRVNCKTSSENNGENTKNQKDPCQHVNNDDDSQHIWYTSKSSRILGETERSNQKIHNLREEAINSAHNDPKYLSVSDKNNDKNEIQTDCRNDEENFNILFTKRKKNCAVAKKSWSCTACTYVNEPVQSSCEVCGTLQDKNISYFPNKKRNNVVSLQRVSYVTIDDGSL